MRSRQQLEKECSRVIKLLLGHMEELAGLPPAQAAHPLLLEERRREIIRAIWNLFKLAVTYDPREEA